MNSDLDIAIEYLADLIMKDLVELELTKKE